MSNILNLIVDKETQDKIIKNEYIQVGDIFYIRKDHVVKKFDDFIEAKKNKNEIQILNEASCNEVAKCDLEEDGGDCPHCGRSHSGICPVAW